jgi:hypothetical protein
MTSTAPESAAQLLQDPPQFSLVHGGPLFQLLRRSHLSSDSLSLVMRRIAAFVLITWVPLAVLAARDGHLLGARLPVPFLLDVETHIRFLVAVPLLLAAELIVHRRLLPVARTFLERNLIPADAMPRFDAAVGSAFRLRNSVTAELLLLLFVYLIGVLVIWRRFAIDVPTWYTALSGDGAQLTHAGVWYAFVSLPIFQFLLLRWYFRLAIWIRFLWQVSRIQLALVPTHPDEVGGLGFLANTVYAFSVLLIAHGALLAGQIANRIFFAGASFFDFKLEIAVLVVFLMCVVFAPLLVFSLQLSWAKRRGLYEYGTFAEGYVRTFDRKWLRGAAPQGEPLLGSSDIQSLADLGNSFSIVRNMQLAPITRLAILHLAAAVLVPLIPLLLTVMPLEELAKKLLGLVF